MESGSYFHEKFWTHPKESSLRRAQKFAIKKSLLRRYSNRVGPDGRTRGWTKRFIYYADEMDREKLGWIFRNEGRSRKRVDPCFVHGCGWCEMSRTYNERRD